MREQSASTRSTEEWQDFLQQQDAIGTRSPLHRSNSIGAYTLRDNLRWALLAAELIVKALMHALGMHGVMFGACS